MGILKYNIPFLFLVFLVASGFSQSDSKYYYYNGNEKQDLTPEYSRISIVCMGDHSKEILTEIFADEKWKVRVASKDYERNHVIATDPVAEKRKNINSTYLELICDQDVTNLEQRIKMETVKKTSMVLTVSTCFKGSAGIYGVSNNIYVKLKNISDVSLLYSKANEMKLEILGNNRYLPLWFTLSCQKITGLNAIQASILLYETELFSLVKPTFMSEVKSASIPNDQYFGDQWYLKNTGQSGGMSGIDIKADKAWDLPTSIGSSAITVGVFDLGIDLAHPDLAGQIIGSWDANFNAPAGSNPPYTGHGTASGGIIGALHNNNTGVSGISSGVKLFNVFMNSATISEQTIANSISHCRNINIDVLNFSVYWTWPSFNGMFYNAIDDALNIGRSGKGMVITYASGNYAGTNFLPQATIHPDILCVGGVERCGIRCGDIGEATNANYPGLNPNNTGFLPCSPWPSLPLESLGSSFGSPLDLVAGASEMKVLWYEDVPSPNHTFRTDDGTSYAAPAVAGVAALMLSANPGLTGQQVRDYMEQTSQKIRPDIYEYVNTPGRPNGLWNYQLGYGMVDAYQAVIKAQNTLCSPLTIHVTAPVTFGQTDDRQAVNQVLATNIVAAGATARYHGGDEVHLGHGFSAYPTSKFHAYQEGCSYLYNRPTNTNDFLPLEGLSLNLTQDESMFDEGARANYFDRKSIAEQSGITILPNPSSGRFTVKSNRVFGSPESITIYDAMGRIISEKKFLHGGENEFDITNQAAGLYLVKVIYRDHVLTKQILKSQ